MFKYVLFFISSSVLVFCTTIFFRLGGHKSVEMKEELRPTLYLMFLEHRGAYHKINDALLKIEEIAKKNSIPCKVTFGEFLDDPQSVDEKHLRSHAGCLLEAPLESSVVSSEKVITKDLPAGKWLIAKFDGAPSIGPFKVYPKLHEYFANKGLRLNPPTFEFYTPHKDGGMTTEYMVPLAQ